MQPISQEYLTLFNAITDAEESLQKILEDLMSAQQQAEELYLERVEFAELPPET